jgi:hypothetical protein
MRILGSIIQPLMLSMLHGLHHLLLCCLVTLEFVGDNYPWHEALFFQEFAEESMCRLCISMSLQQDIQHGLTFHVKSCNAYEERVIALPYNIRYSSQGMVLENKQMQEWWEKNFTNCELGDRRLSQRGRVIGRALSLGFGKALSEVFSGANALKRAYEFLAM